MNMNEITSVNNEIIKETAKLKQKKYRESSRLFIVEGEKSLAELVKNKVEIKYIFSLENSNITLKIDSSKIISVSESVMKKISTTESIPKILTVAHQEKEPENFAKFKRIILLDSIKDSGNAGTIIRSAAAFNIDLIILFGDCCDFYASKVIRSAVGNFFKVPIIKYSDIKKLKSDFSSYCFISTDLSKKTTASFDELRKHDKFIFMFGSEADGLNKQLSNIADKNFLLNINSNVESLNLATSVSIVMYELNKS